MKRTVMALGAGALVAGLLTGSVAASSGANPIDTILEKLDELLIASRNVSVDLRPVTQNWDKDLPANDPGGPCPSSSSRFSCIFGDAAVRDNETGLVWEQAPTADLYAWSASSSARNYCLTKVVGGKRGWRLPSIVELGSLIEPGMVDPALPDGHPFSNVSPSQVRGYASATASAENLASIWMLTFHDGFTGFGAADVPVHVWCVRGGSDADRY